MTDVPTALTFASEIMHETVGIALMLPTQYEPGIDVLPELDLNLVFNFQFLIRIMR